MNDERYVGSADCGYLAKCYQGLPFTFAREYCCSRMLDGRVTAAIHSNDAEQSALDEMPIHIGSVLCSNYRNCLLCAVRAIVPYDREQFKALFAIQLLRQKNVNGIRIEWESVASIITCEFMRKISKFFVPPSPSPIWCTHFSLAIAIIRSEAIAGPFSFW